MKTLKEWKEFLSKKPTDVVSTYLNVALENIKFLESIYQTGGNLNRFSQRFSDAAFAERQDICQISSACYSILRERGIKC